MTTIQTLPCCESTSFDVAAVPSIRPSRTRRAKIIGVATWAALVMALNVPNAAMAGPFSNGDFETPSHPGYVTIPNGGTIGAWTVTSGSVDHGTAPAQTPCQTAGGQCVDLNGNGPGVISQTFDTCKPTYRVDFFMSRHKVLDKQTATVVALINAVPVAGGTFTHGPSPAPGTWVAHSFTFVGTYPTTTIAFKSTTNANPAAAGPEIDNVTIKMVSCN